jgi:hypothetical protein
MFFLEKIRRISTDGQGAPLVWMKIATFCLLLGKAWQHLRWDPPYRAWLWDEKWMRSLIEKMGWTWQAYLNSPVIEQNIRMGIKSLGLALLLAAFSVFLPQRLGRVRNFLLMIASLILFFVALLICKDQGWQLGQFLELVLQWATPVLYVLWQKDNRNAVFWTKIAIASTFIGHGMYALGWYPRPGAYLDMCINGLGISQNQAVTFLNTAGTLDLLASILIFIPFRGSMGVYIYLIGWGFLTAIARVWSHFSWDFLGNWAEMWLHEWLMRFPHFLVPLFLWKSK